MKSYSNTNRLLLNSFNIITSEKELEEIVSEIKNEVLSSIYEAEKRIKNYSNSIPHLENYLKKRTRIITEFQKAHQSDPASRIDLEYRFDASVLCFQAKFPINSDIVSTAVKGNYCYLVKPIYGSVYYVHSEHLVDWKTIMVDLSEFGDYFSGSDFLEAYNERTDDKIDLNTACRMLSTLLVTFGVLTFRLED